VIDPDDVIEPYDATIADRRPFGGPSLSPADFRRWLYAQVQRWRCRYVTPTQVPRLVVLAGRAYWGCLREHRLEVCVPLDGLGLGERLRWLKQQLAARRDPAAKPFSQLPLFPDTAPP
jgi:hypothetical protein